MKTLTRKEKEDYDYLLKLGVDLEKFWQEIEQYEKEQEVLKRFDATSD